MGREDDDLEALVAAIGQVRPRLVRQVLARQARRSAAATPGARLTTPQHLAMLALAERPLTISELAEATGVAVSSATRMVQGLERAGLLAEAPERPGAADRRRRYVTLTPAGRAAMEEASALLRQRFREVLEPLEGPARRAILEGMVALVEALQRDEERAAASTLESKEASTSANDNPGGESGVAASGRSPSSTIPR